MPSVFFALNIERPESEIDRHYADLEVFYCSVDYTITITIGE